MPDAIHTVGLRKRYGAAEVLRGLDLAIPPGLIYGLVGPNGAGKTTLFRVLVGLVQPTSGEVQVLGLAPGASAARAAIGYMTQAEALYEDLSVRQNVRFFGRIHGLKGAELTRAADEAIALVELTNRANDRVLELSGGMRRRASLACALVHKPRLLLLDEPTVGVDPELRLRFWETFARLTAAGTSLLISTHHLEETRRCHRLGLLRAGALLAEGTPAELMERAGATNLEETFLAFSRQQAPENKGVSQ